MNKKPVINLTVRDLSGEVWRKYIFASGVVHFIEGPVKLYTRPGGTTHRIVDAKGIVHCIAFPGPNGDTVLQWSPKNDSVPVAF